MKKPFHCEADAKQAQIAHEKEQTIRFHQVDISITQHEQVKKKRGRSKQGAPIEMETISHVHLAASLDQQAIALERRRSSRFVLATTLEEKWLD